MKAFVVSHVHWDREWYLGFDEFRVKLVLLIDEVLRILDTDPEYCAFMLDGQTIVIEDYLSVRPENEARLRDYIRGGRLQVGPWYVLPDELLISGESHIRNFLTGKRLMEQLGAEMYDGYLPDSFGHPPQMPQILHGLGLRSFVFWRGASREHTCSEFWWRAPDGSRVLAAYMPFGYGNCARLSTDMEITAPRLSDLIEKLGDCSSAGAVLLMNGSDHILPQSDLTAVLSAARARLPGVTLKHTTLADYIEHISQSGAELKTYSGELRFTQRSLLLGGTLSTRMPLKQANSRLERLAERTLEPLLTLDALSGGTLPDGLRRLVWKSILQNQPHDSICGCSVDAVHDEMAARFQAAERLIQELSGRAARHLACSITPVRDADAVAMVFNPLPVLWSGYLELEICLDRSLQMEVHFPTSRLNHYDPVLPPPPVGLTCTDAEGRAFACALLSVKESDTLQYNDDTLPEAYRAWVCRVAVNATDLPALGYTTLYFDRAEELSVKPCSGSGHSIENEFFTVAAQRDGTLEVISKQSGAVWNGIHRFRDTGDAGDEYTFSPPEHDSLFTMDEESVAVSSESVPVFWQRLTITGSLALPEGLTNDRESRSDRLVRCPVCTTVTLYAGQKSLVFETVVENNAKDHKLAVVFPTCDGNGVSPVWADAETQFGVVRRPLETDTAQPWLEIPPSCHPLHGFVACGAGQQGGAVVGKGLREYEGTPDGTLALTLLRCAGWLSREDLAARQGNGGWTIETPGAQCSGTNSFQYAFVPYDGASWENTEVAELAEHFLHEPTTCQVYHFTGEQPPVRTLVKAWSKSWRLSACKPAEDGDGFILRFYSLLDTEKSGRVVFGVPVVSAGETNLAEAGYAPLDVTENAVVLTLHPQEIKTLRLHFA